MGKADLNFECHVTVPYLQSKEQDYEMYAKIFNFKTSTIKGDPLLGEKNHFYFTCHEKEYEKIAFRMGDLVEFLRRKSVFVLRQKIELIMLDERFE